MKSLEAVVTKIQRLSSTSTDIKRLLKFLKKSDDSLRSSASTHLFPLLSLIDPSIHTLGFLYILDAYTAAVSEQQPETLVPIIARFISACSTGQIRLAADKFISVCKRLKDQVLLLEAPIRGVLPMLTALRKLQPSSEHVTPLHPEFLQLCLLAKCYKTGLSILDDDVFKVDDPWDIFLYFYYGGMICIGQKHFQKAMDLLHYVITAPMDTLSAIAVEAYKKYILVSLIHHRQFSSSLPTYSSSVAHRNLKVLCEPYIELANGYSSGTITELEAYVNTNAEKFESDNNLGLVKQVVSSMFKRNIQRLTKAYLTLSLQDIANTVQLNSAKEAEMHMLQMIQDGEIYATINQEDGMVRFLEDPEQYKTFESIEHIDSSIRRVMELTKKLTLKNEQVSNDQSHSVEGRKKKRGI